MLRSVLLGMAESRWLREHATRTAFVRRAVRRFMPGESFDDMLAAARTLHGEGIGSLFTRLGEGVTDLSEAEAVTRHYVESIERVRASGLPCEPSVKPTQLGLDLGFDACLANVRTVATAARAAGRYLWIDMEQSSYVDRTLDLIRRIRPETPELGVALQSYLRRTPADLEAMLALGVGVRLVKGAYREPEAVAFPRKADVDAAFLTLAGTMLQSRNGAGSGSRVVFGTHDLAIVEAIRARARGMRVPPAGFEVHMLYGIQRAAQLELARAGVPVTVLIAYGSHWFQWYMRRLAERPANVGFLLRSLAG